MDAFVACCNGISDMRIKDEGTQWIKRTERKKEESGTTNLDGGRDFLYPSRPALSTTQLPIKWVPCVIPGNEAVRAWR
jgi:hypothetical protein